MTQIWAWNGTLEPEVSLEGLLGGYDGKFPVTGAEELLYFSEGQSPYTSNLGISVNSEIPTSLSLETF